MWHGYAFIAIVLTLASCKGMEIGYVPTEPVSLPTSNSIARPLCLNVSGVSDTIKFTSLDFIHYSVVDVRHTLLDALSGAFRATFPAIQGNGGAECYQLQVVSLTANYRPLTLEEQKARETASGVYRSYSIDLTYKALFFNADSLVATFTDVLNTRSPKGDRRADLKTAMEHMAEELNAKVVRFLLRQPDE